MVINAGGLSRSHSARLVQVETETEMRGKSSGKVAFGARRVGASG